MAQHHIKRRGLQMNGGKMLEERGLRMKGDKRLEERGLWMKGDKRWIIYHALPIALILLFVITDLMI